MQAGGSLGNQQRILTGTPSQLVPLHRIGDVFHDQCEVTRRCVDRNMVRMRCLNPHPRL